MKHGAKALIITVNFRQAESTVQFVKSARSLETFEASSLLIVDNNSSDGSCPMIRRALSGCDNAELLASPQNRGYFGAASWALRHYLASRSTPDWVVVCNNDIAFADPHVLLRLFEKDPAAAAALAPSIISGITGHDQNPYMRYRPSALRMHIYKWVYRSRLLLNLTDALAVFLKMLRTYFSRVAGPVGSSPLPANSQDDVYAPHGSFLILSKEYFARGGSLDFPGFLFGEEIYIAETIRRLGLSVVYCPELQVFHHEHRSTRLFKSRKLAADLAFSAAYCADAFFPLRARD
ncbi:MAG TPA: glycosyltransferase [Candidatus Sulfotelmatobacter sp.]